LIRLPNYKFENTEFEIAALTCRTLWALAIHKRLNIMKLSFRIRKNIDHVFDHLTDMKKFVSVHPVIFNIDYIGNESYLVHETLKLGFIPFSFTYPVTIKKNDSDKTVFIKAIVFNLSKIEMNFILRSDNDYTFIEEEIHFKSLLPIKFIMQSIFRKQHTQLFKNIEQK
jgi:carbon monoxide dehydrogenase subunit G